MVAKDSNIRPSVIDGKKTHYETFTNRPFSSFAYLSLQLTWNNKLSELPEKSVIFWITRVLFVFCSLGRTE